MSNRISLKKRSVEDEAYLCEFLKALLPPPGKRDFPDEVYKSIKPEDMVGIFRNRGVPIPSVAVARMQRFFYKWVEALLAVENLYSEIFNLPTGSSPEENQRKSKLFRQVDRAIFDYVAAWKRGLFDHPLVNARISLADDSGDIEFFEGLSSAVRKRVGFHGRVPLKRLTKAAEMLEEGKDISEIYNRLYEAGEIGPMEPKEFYKFLQRHGLISRKRQKSSRVTRGKKI